MFSVFNADPLRTDASDFLNLMKRVPNLNRLDEGAAAPVNTVNRHIGKLLRSPPISQ
jgi:hypothetical protein